ncbi:MFS transporter [Paenibacillus protaetiae]|uniref:MFS transporter n=1 Tax=Paenibacillus protaetiae TaxID=2509456 RepID=A0A4P6F5S4_9BACL|nr:MFS transporter [Paenibacillus protaetiae]QAY65748.1 MFS transporter [Paenibacillus protaetiae]
MKKIIWIGSLSYFLIGLAHVVLGAVLPVLLDHYGKAYGLGGTLIFAQFAGFLGGVLLSPLINRSIGKRNGLLLAVGLLLAAEVLYSLLLPWGLLYVVAPIAGFGFGMIEAVIGTIVIAAVTSNAAVAMSRLEVLFGVGAMVMPLAASGLISLGYWRLAFLVIALFAAITFIFWWKSAFGEIDRVLDERVKPSAASKAQSKAKFAYRGKNRVMLVLFILFFFLYVGTEMSLANFLPAFLIRKLQMSEAGSALSVTCFWIAMSFARLFAGYVAEKVQYKVYLLFSCAAAAVLLMLLPLAGQVWSAFAVVALLGLAFSGVFSIALVFVSKMIVGAEEKTPSLMIASGGVGGAVLPLFTGWSMDHMEVNQSIWILALFSIGLFLIIAAVYRSHKQTSQVKEGVQTT